MREKGVVERVCASLRLLECDIFILATFWLIPSVSTQQLSVQCGMHKYYEQSVAILGARKHTVMHVLLLSHSAGHLLIL